MGTVIMHNVVSVDGFIADENDDIGPLHDWYFSGDTPITEGRDQQYDHSGVGSAFKVSSASAGYVRSMWEAIGGDGHGHAEPEAVLPSLLDVLGRRAHRDSRSRASTRFPFSRHALFGTRDRRTRNAPHRSGQQCVCPGKGISVRTRPCRLHVASRQDHTRSDQETLSVQAGRRRPVDGW
ncbi:hypothetical protein [Nonomuraea sp. CA-141351]|uniref:hypothetical protein n=1 Tax=Nonomuraea sp. CA-141351 TaxID=3239996 RepID=UPI003D8DB6E2